MVSDEGGQENVARVEFLRALDDDRTAVADASAAKAVVVLCQRCGFVQRDVNPIEPVAKGYIRLSNLEIDRIAAALTRASHMALADERAEEKVATLLRKYFDIPSQVLEQRRKQMFKRITPPGAQEITPRINEMRQLGLSDLLNETQDVPDVPKKFILNATDFPKQQRGEARDAQLSSIKFGLGFLYELSEIE